MRNSIYTTWPLYLSVVFLILNDHLFKYVFPGLITGKLSDFAGIFLLVLVLRALHPRERVMISMLVIASFTYWKSQYSQTLINLINSYSPLEIVRTVDYSDLVSFVMIPVAHYVYEQRDRYSINVRFAKLLKIPMILVTVIGITGTSVLLPHHKY